MAHSRSAWKRVRQNERCRARNRARQSRLRTEMKKLLGLIKAGDAAKAGPQYAFTAKLLDKAAGAGTIHANKAARHKSRLAAAIARIGKTKS
jgi:small subunit ribosomal protein S20